ncbi:hypothetical protein V8F33_012932 [Rhypophila sp. PSN 637]
MLYCTVPSVLLLAAIFIMALLSVGAPRQPRRRPHDLEMGIDPTTVWAYQHQQRFEIGGGDFFGASWTILWVAVIRPAYSAPSSDSLKVPVESQRCLSPCDAGRLLGVGTGNWLAFNQSRAHPSTEREGLHEYLDVLGEFATEMGTGKTTAYDYSAKPLLRGGTVLWKHIRCSGKEGNHKVEVGITIFASPEEDV